jgi:hypothetical protein
MQNQESDRADGDKVSNALYSLLSEDKFDETDRLFGEEFFKITSKEQLRAIFEKTRSALGKFKGNKLGEWETVETSGSVNRTDYVMKYEVEYEKGMALETVRLMKKGDGPVKIVGYHVNSDALMK